MTNHHLEMKTMASHPLLFLATIALDTVGENPHDSRVLSSRQTSQFGAPPSFVITTLHIPPIPCEQSESLLPSTKRAALKRSNTSNGLDTTRRAYMSTRPMGLRKKQTQKSLRLQKMIKGELRARQKENLARAMRITSLENSPVNDRQLRVLRMVYDEITMYPSEPWIALLAIALHRAFKQVKNWFSNERQRHRVGDSICVLTDAGDRVRLRPLALQLRPDWSDSFFEEVIMIYHYRVQRCMRAIR